MKEHQYQVKVEWTGNQGKGTRSYKAYNRNHRIFSEGKQQEILGSADVSFMGDRERYNLEEMFLSSLSACHMLWYLHLCAVNDVILTYYKDEATGILEETEDGAGRFVEVNLHPKIRISNRNMLEKAMQLHTEANKKCFIANSCNFKIGHKPEIKVGETLSPG